MSRSCATLMSFFASSDSVAEMWRSSWRRTGGSPDSSTRRLNRRGEVFGDDTVAAAMIDRLVHHAEVISVKGDSYRLRGRDLGRVPAVPRCRRSPPGTVLFAPAEVNRRATRAEGERDEPTERAAVEQHPDVPRTEPSQAEGERVDDFRTT